MLPWKGNINIGFAIISMNGTPANCLSRLGWQKSDQWVNTRKKLRNEKSPETRNGSPCIGTSMEGG